MITERHRKRHKDKQMQAYTFFETNFYKNYKAKVDALNPYHFKGIYFQAELDEMYDWYDEIMSWDLVEDSIHDEMVRQYDQLYKFFIAGSIHDKELSARMHDINGIEIEFE